MTPGSRLLAAPPAGHGSALRANARAAAPCGPVWSMRRGLPLSAFRDVVANDERDTWSRVLGTLLEQPAASSTPIAPLMQRAVSARAVAGPHAFPPLPPEWHRSASPRVLVIDERTRSSRGDRRQREQAFAKLIDTALARHPGAEIWVAPSSDAGRGAWLSHGRPARSAGRLRRIDVPGAICAMLPEVERVYTIAASEGMHALMAGKPVEVFGMPNYAGWGLTHDHAPLPERRARPTLARLFECLYLELAVYLDPATFQQGSLEQVLSHLELQAAVRSRFGTLQRVAGLRFQYWKRPFATPYLLAGDGQLRWEDEPKRIARGETAALWGGRNLDALPTHAEPLWIEDGFIHSTGLGSDMIAPCSQVLDRSGIYFDATRPNDLLTILNGTEFGEPELARARALRDLLVAHGITKYNLGRRRPVWRQPAGRHVALVIGQVADDASIRLGTATIRTADELLQAVRERDPAAFIVYKPHPDVLSGNRQGLIAAGALADAVDPDADIVSLIEACDSVHTLSSLAGFDALLRGKAVHTYGLPFYAGWGLTVDALPQPRRTRPLTLDMLTAGALLRYPVYWDWRLSMYTTPEAVVHQLAPAAARSLARLRGDRWRQARKISRWLRNVAAHALWRYRHANARTAKLDTL